ncbi:MAG TPA: type II CAAX endopeptidase family protein [Myxococcota bacterium]|jgi:membrane protease YdiL (CAAX protease family)|nr:type II CAAX endopeptidase family protein [Myxococcota bacterium]
MNPGRHAPLILVGLFVIAVATLLSLRQPPLPAPVLSSLQVRQVAFMARMAVAPPGQSTGTPALAAPLVAALESMAHRPVAVDRDALAGATVAMALGAPHVAGAFAAPLAHRDPAAAILARRAFDPMFVPTASDLAWIRVSTLDRVSQDIAIARMAPATPQGEDALAGWTAWWTARMAAGSGLAGAGIAVLVVGIVLWFRARRLQIAARGAERTPWTVDAVLPPVYVMVVFMAIALTGAVLGPPVLRRAFPAASPSELIVALYLLTGAAGLWLVGRLGRQHPSQRWADLVGLAGSFAPGNLGRALAWGLGGYCMLWPAVMAAAAFSSMLGAGGEPFDNPIALLLVSDPDSSSLALLGIAVALMAPALEEPLFRGYLFGRLRRHMTPYGAAALSGLVFALAHFSLENLLPLWAIGFALGVLYDRTRDLAAPIVAHALWNLVTAGALLTVFG